MKQYAWIMAACLTAAMVSGCGSQTGQETSEIGEVVSESTASGAEVNQMM
ncbi:MAG: hypothetical protein ACLUYY_11555 [Blautia sp.]